MACSKPHCTEDALCFRCKALTISISAHALETKGKPVVAIDKKEGGWKVDIPAYRRLRKQGLQPKSIDGSARIEARAETKAEVELGKIIEDKGLRDSVDEAMRYNPVG